MAASDLTLPATVATELGGGVQSSDPRLPRLIAVASNAILQHLNRKQLHYAAGFEESLAGYGTPRLLLSLTPVLSVTEVLLDGTEVDPASYSIEDADAGILRHSNCWAWTGVNRGGLPPQTDRAAGSERPAYALTYTGGYVTPAQAAGGGPARSLPYDLEEACIQAVVALYRGNGRDPEVASEALGAYSVSYRGQVGGIVPDKMLPLLARYVRPV